MQSIQTNHDFSLSAIKPLEGLLKYRDFCLQVTKKVLHGKGIQRKISPIDGQALEIWDSIGPFEYVRCRSTGSLFLANVEESQVWKNLLAEVADHRHSPTTFHAGISKSRMENVFEPKLYWILNTLRLQGVKKPKIVELVTLPSSFTSLLRERGAFAEVLAIDETDFSTGKTSCENVNAAILLESLDRVADPLTLLQKTFAALAKGGLAFVTALVSSGFDMTILGKHNAYLYPPDRTNFFSLLGLQNLLAKAGFSLIEVSTPGVLDVEIVKAHLAHYPSIVLSAFEKNLLASGSEAHAEFQSFLQRSNMSSFARIVAQKVG